MAEISRKASAHWQGDLKTGKGTVNTESGALKDAPYGFQSRFESGAGSNPEELLASAHAACFTMQLSALLTNHGHTVEDLRTEATCEMVKDGPGFKVSAMRLVVRGKVTGSDQQDFKEHVKQAAEMCPLSKVMRGNVDITHQAILE